MVFFTGARKLLNTGVNHLHEIVDYVFSPEAQPHYADNLVVLLNQLKNKGTLRAPTHRQRLFLDRQLLFINQRKGNVSKIAAYSLKKDVSVTPFKWNSIRYWIEKKDAWKIKYFFSKSFNSLTELISYVDLELKPYNVRLYTLSRYFHFAVLNNPHWLKSTEDLDLLLANEYFWPQHYSDQAIDSESFEGSILKIFNQLAQNYPNVWKYEPGSSEQLHRLYMQRLSVLGLFPQDFEGKFKLWRKLTSRGVTSVTDELFHEIYRNVPVHRRDEVEQMALEGRIWEMEIKSKIAQNQVEKQPIYTDLKQASEGETRLELLKQVITLTQKFFPEKGHHYYSFLEKISTEIRSTSQESALIHEAKYPTGGERQEDFGLRVFSDLIGRITSWKLKHQWNFVLFLRGEAGPNSKVQDLFRVIGTERIKRMFSLFPHLVKTSLLDTLLDSPKGLIPNVNPNKGYTKKIIAHLLRNASFESREVSQQILEAFLYALERTGHTGVKSYVLAYLLAMSPNETESSGQVLKKVLEVFGTTGIKIGQFLVASQLLPEADTRHLRSLQDRALIPERESIYRDLREINNGQDLPIEIQDLLGSASLKYAISAMSQQESSSFSEHIVLKILRIEAIANTAIQFRQLDAMVDYLVKTFGSRYGVFHSIVQAAKQAVERELNLKDEAVKSKKARQIYKNDSDSMVEITVPNTVLMHDRLIAEEFAEGVSIFDIQKIEDKAVIAKKLLEVEGYHLFRSLDDPEALVTFDPDRHPGNYRLKVKPDGSIQMYLIDWGQMLSITAQQREEIFTLFALAQILKVTGPTDWASHQIIQTMDLTIEIDILKQALKRYFPSSQMNEVTTYYSVLATLSDLNLQPHIGYFDFIRAIIQLSQYEVFLTEPIMTPIGRFKEVISLKVEDLLSQMELTFKEKARIGIQQLSSKIQQNVSESFNNDEVEYIQGSQLENEENTSCPEALTKHGP